MFFYVLLTVVVIAFAAFTILEPFAGPSTKMYPLHSTRSKLETVFVNLLGAFGGFGGIFYFFASAESLRATIISVMGGDLLFMGLLIAIAGFVILGFVWIAFITVWKENIQTRDRIAHEAAVTEAIKPQ